MNNNEADTASKKLNRQTVHTQQRPVKVLQFGEGNFLRGFADWIIDILNEKTNFNGDVQIVQPRAHGHHKGKMINDQDGLYHVVLKGIKNGITVDEIRLITCVQQVINAYHDFELFLKCGENPALQFMISNTTEAGIIFNEADASPDVVPETFPGKLTALLYHRFKFFDGAADKGLIHLPCELLEKNGESLKKCVLQYCDAWQLPDVFRKWIQQHNTFCNTLVDRIVPGFPTDTIDEITKVTGFDDPLTVMAEPYYVWVIEGDENVKKKIPALEAGLNVKFVKDLTPYRTLKVRILNGAHTALMPVAYLKGLRTVMEAMDDPSTATFVNQVMMNEILEVLPYPVFELKAFAQDVNDRFRNPFIRHELASIALNSISKFKVRVLPTLIDFEKIHRKLPDNIVLALASLICFYKGTWRNETTPVNDSDEVISFFKEVWQDADMHIVAKKVLGNTSLWGRDLNLVPRLTDRIGELLKEC